MATQKITNGKRMASARRVAELHALHPSWPRDRIGREAALPGPRGAREKAVLRLLQLIELPISVQQMFLNEELSFAATEELGAHRGLTDAEKIAVSHKIVARAVPSGGKQLRAVLDWLSAARYHSYGKQFLADRQMTYDQAVKLQDEAESRRQDAIDREAEKETLSRATEAQRLGPQVVRELSDIVDRLRVMDELMFYVAHDRMHRPRVAGYLLNAQSIVSHMLSGIRHEEQSSQIIDTEQA